MLNTKYNKLWIGDRWTVEIIFSVIIVWFGSCELNR